MVQTDLMVSIARTARGKVRTDVPLAPYTSYKIGGPAAVLFEPETEESVGQLLHDAAEAEVPVLVIGGGCNMLIADSGWHGIALHMGEGLASLDFDQDHVSVQAGAKLMNLVRESVRHGFSGMELMAGIPGTVGGALRMNAGAFGQEIEATVTTVRGFGLWGKPFELKRKRIAFGYRTAPELDDKVITSAEFSYTQENPEFLVNRMNEVLKVRNQKQPLEHPSCGSVFKRPPGYFAGSLIEESGLKGKRVGGAVVSEKHAGFILNDRNATAADVRELIWIVEETVNKKFGVRLEREVKLIGFDDAI